MPYQAFDLRLGASVGWNLRRVMSPYMTARVFGRPVNWSIAGQSVSGTVLYHYQVGAGLSFLIDSRYDVFVDGIGLGEQGISAGLGVAF